MRIACVGYRKWALDIYDKLCEASNHSFFIIRTKKQYNEDAIIDFNPDIVLYYGWSWIVPKKMTKHYECIMLHPSPLPLYRGGSPIQNQIISGATTSAVTLLYMEDEVDAGDIIVQEKISLTGSLDDIFDRIIRVGYRLTIECVIEVENITSFPQNNIQATYCKRRAEHESEITIDELRNESSIYIYNKIRMLAHPYPNAYIKTSDGKKIILNNVEIMD